MKVVIYSGRSKYEKPIRDNWHNVSIVVCAFYHEFQLWLFYKTFIRTPLTVLYLNSLKRFLLLAYCFKHSISCATLTFRRDFIMANQKR